MQSVIGAEYMLRVVKIRSLPEPGAVVVRSGRRLQLRERQESGADTARVPRRDGSINFISSG